MEKNSNQNLDNYNDLDGVSLKKLETGLWFIEHKVIFKKVFIIILLIISSISWTYSLYGFAYYLFFGMQQDQQLVNEMAASPGVDHEYIVRIAPKNLLTDSAQVLSSSEQDKYDFLAQISNTNNKHWARFNYYFIADGKPGKKETSYIFPNETKYLISLANKFDSMPVDSQLKIEDFIWQKLPGNITDWQSYKDQHLNIEISDIKYSAARASGLSEKVGLGQLEFNVSNLSAYNYFRIDFVTLFYSQGNIVEVNLYNMSDFNSGEKKMFQASFIDQSGRIDKIVPIPQVNILDSQSFIKFQGAGDNTIYEIEKNR